MRIAICPFHMSKGPALPGKSEARSYEVLRLSRKITLANLKISCSKMQLPSGNLRPDLLTRRTHVSFVLRLPLGMHPSRSPSNVPRPPSFWQLLQNPHALLTFDKVHNSPHQPGDIGTSKSGPNVWCFEHFGLETASRHGGAHFSSSQLPKVHWLWCASRILTWKHASGHEGVHFSSSPKVRWLRRASYILTWKHASCHDGVHFFDISTFKLAPKPSLVLHSWLPHVLRATAACTLSTS